MAETQIPDDLIPAGEAASLLGRSKATLRRWERRGFAPSGCTIVAFRDTVTNDRWYSRAAILRVRRTLFRVVVET